jgi:sugar lactone lactonase YvrE
LAAAAALFASLAPMWMGSGCGGAAAEVCPVGSGEGTVVVVVTGHDTAAVTIEGVPGVLSGSASVSASAGAHTVTAARVRAAQAGITSQVFAPTIDHASVCVGAGETAMVNVAYALVPTSGKLWAGVGDAPDGSTMLGFGPASVATTGSASADVAANTGGSDGFTFDRAGNLWVVGGTTDAPPLARYPAAMFAGDGDKTPDVVINSPTFGDSTPGPRALAFDSAGDLWVSVGSTDEVVMFTADQLAAGGSPAAAVERGGLTGPQGIAFDAAGNLWVAAEDDAAVVRIDRSNVGSSGTGGDLSIVATGTNDVTLRPVGLAFDAAGNLWVNYDGTIARLTPAEQTGSGSRTLSPGVQITTDVLTLPVGIAFDQDGGLWLAHATGRFARIAPAQLAASGSMAPATVITSPDVGYAAWFAIYPAPPGLPLFHKVP